jgi:RNA polymerase sigma-70 factor (ECF subfamily)
MSIVDQNELIPTRQSLLERLRSWDDHAAWQEFFDTYWKLIYRAAFSAGLSPTESEEVVQETIVAVARQMPDFRYVPAVAGGSFKKWLLNLTKWRITDQLRRRLRDRRFSTASLADNSTSDELAKIPDPVGNRLEQLWEAEWEQNLLEAAISRLKLRVDPKHFQIFDLCVLKEWSGLRVARSLKVSVPQVYTVKHRLARQLKTVLEHLRNHGWEER